MATPLEEIPALVGGVLNFTGINGFQAVQPIPVTPETCCSLATAIPLPQGLEADDIETVELLTVNGTLLDRLGVPGQTLGSLEIFYPPQNPTQMRRLRAQRRSVLRSHEDVLWRWRSAVCKLLVPLSSTTAQARAGTRAARSRASG